MNDAKYIGLDVHQATISAAVRDSDGKLVLCPLAQPEKAIGYESQIELWLALTTTLLDASETDALRQQDESGESEKSRILTSIHGLDGSLRMLQSPLGIC